MTERMAPSEIADQLYCGDGNCPFCGRDPYHYVDNGVGMERVAVTCCDEGVGYFQYRDTFLTEQVNLRRQAAATIRELEKAAMFRVWTKDTEPLLAKVGELAADNYDLQAKLKIATEALEVVANSGSFTCFDDDKWEAVNSALARIKEVG